MRPRVVIGVLVVVLVTAAACSSKKKDTAGTTTSVTASAASTVTPSSAPGSATTNPSAGGAVKATTAESASNQLFEAWKANDKAKARQVANEASVTELFSHPYTGPSPDFQGCEQDGSEYLCSYTYEGGAMQFTVEGSATAGYRVTNVDYIAD